jgi:O-antigen/teichoic acid export membrane protein
MLKEQGQALQRFVSCLRLQPFAADTPEGRAKERIRKAGLTALAAMLARAVSMLTPLISVPLTFKYLGLERYGMWQTIASFAGFMVFADLGLGNGIVSRIAHAEGKKDRETIIRTISTVFFLLCAMALLSLSLYALMAPFIPWFKVFNVKTSLAIAEASPAMTVFMVCFLLNLPIAVVQKVQLAFQDGFNSYLWQCVANLAGLGMILWAVSCHFTLPGLMLGLMAVPLLVTCLNAADYFGWRRRGLAPRWQFVDRHTAKALLTTGGAFLVISALMSAGLGADNIIAAQVLGPDAVARLSVPARMALPLVAVAQMLYLPMWSANAEAIARGDSSWVRQTAAKLTRMTVILTATGALVLLLAGPWAVRWLTRHDLETNYTLLAGLGAWAVLLAASGPGFMVLNAAHILRPQIYMYSVFLVFSVGIKIWLAPRFGIEGIVWVGDVVYLFAVLLPLRALVQSTLNRLATDHPGHQFEASPEVV